MYAITFVDLPSGRTAVKTGQRPQKLTAKAKLLSDACNTRLNWGQVLFFVHLSAGRLPSNRFWCCPSKNSQMTFELFGSCILYNERVQQTCLRHTRINAMAIQPVRRALHQKVNVYVPNQEKTTSGRSIQTTFMTSN